MNFLEKIEVNPKISLEKGKVYPFVEMANVGFYTREPSLIEEKPFTSGVKFEDGDTVIARITPCLQNGKGFYCHDLGKGFGSTEYLVFRPKDDSVDNQYLYYLMQTDYIRESMIKSMVGATGRQRVNNDVFKRIDIDFPEIAVQNKVANTLSAYDNLIENNQKQIKLLEEAAQRLYKEWFVDLHFPGYENTEIVDGVPEGWKRKKISDVFSYIRGKSYTTKELCEVGGNLLVNLKNIQAWGGYKRSAEKRFMGKYKEEQLLSYGDIIMAVTDMTQERRLVGHVALVPELNEKAVYSMDIIKIIPEEGIPSFYLYSMLRFSGIAENISKHANGTNVLHLKPDSICNLEVVVPTYELMKSFDGLSSNICKKIEILQNQMLLCQQARDRLLPKLMSGELEVKD